jgi:signal recognition particle receptor subunit beta
MVFFNYATMQMAAKIVYYGPGLCGKTTNLHHIYSRTAPGSRGEMVSLETETDRTLFFDLLPLDVGVIGGFKTRVQLYTVPGQVFYNTTRKLVLKGVDGIVFVADSQRAMKEANVESMNNLRSNLAEIGVKLEDLPLVLQFNKRDLSNILTVQELQETMNSSAGHETYEACAVLGQGVFETLKAISRLTLRSLKKRMLGEERPSRVIVAPPLAPVVPVPPPVEVKEVSPPPPPPPRAIEVPEVIEPPASLQPPFAPAEQPAVPELLAVEEFDAEDVETVNEFEQALNSLDAPLPDEESPGEPLEVPEVSFEEAAPPPARAERPPEPEVKHVRVRSNIDILAELEKLRKNATSVVSVQKPARQSPPGISIDDLLASSLNHRKEVNRIFELQMPQRHLAAGQQVVVRLHLEGKDHKVLGEEKSFAIDLNAKQEIERLLLSLKFHIRGK